MIKFDNRSRAITLLFFAIVFSGCDESFIPRPKGYIRIDFPDKKYTELKSDCPFIFEYPLYSRISRHVNIEEQPCWLNLDFPKYRGRLHLSYFDLQANADSTGNHTLFKKYLEDSRSLAYKHTIKAEAIDEVLIRRDMEHVHGVVYEIRGANTASSLQFFLTDSNNHFMRGALYFSVVPKNDSLAPVINFIKADVNHFINSFKWKADSTSVN